MENEKTLNDLNNMKNNKMLPFGNQYEHFFAMLEDFYITKMDGKERIKAELSHWNIEAQKEIVCKLVDVIESNGLIIGFNKEDILSLAE